MISTKQKTNLIYVTKISCKDDDYKCMIVTGEACQLNQPRGPHHNLINNPMVGQAKPQKTHNNHWWTHNPIWPVIRMSSLFDHAKQVTSAVLVAR